MTQDEIIAAIRALKPNQQHVLGCIAINEDGGHHPTTLKVLEAKGLIEGRKVLLPGYPPMIVKRWSTPLPVHMAWAKWCSEQPDDEGAAGAPG